MPKEAKNDGLAKPYQMITDRIVEMLQAGVVPWRKPWNADIADPRNLASGKEYRGINVFLLEATAAMAGYRSPYWLTFRQALERGGHVRKGERATTVVFWKILQRGDSDEESADEADTRPDQGGRRIPILKHFHVFNVEQCDGIERPPLSSPTERPFDPIIRCEQIVQAMPRPPTIEHREPRAAYSPARDAVNMPRPETFASAQDYYSTLFHELTHATGHPARLDRDAIRNPAPFGSAGYAKEELIAEMGAAFLCGRAGIEQTTLENSAAYVQSWIVRLRGDPKLAVHAAAAAQKSADWILGESRAELQMRSSEALDTIARNAGRER